MMEQMMQEAAGKVIPAGYKQTEVGIIPEDWTVANLSAITEHSRPISYGIVQTGPLIVNGVPCIRVVDISDGKIKRDNLITTTKEISDSYRRTILKDGDLIIPLRGKVGEVGLVDGDLVGANLTRGVALIAPQKDYASEFIKQYLSNRSSADRLLSSMNGSALQEITIETLRRFSIALPIDVKEQTAIGNVLSDSDALIDALEQLIAKKQAIKTAAMQQLLTGRTRLPQFALCPDGTPKGYKSSELGQIPEDWEVLAIDDCATKVGSGKTPNGGASVYIDAGRPFVRSQNIGWGKLILDDVAYISDDIHNTFSGSEIKEGDVLLNITGASIGRCAITEGYIVGGNVNQHVCIIRLNSVLLNARLLVELINSRNGQKQIDSYQAGGNREGLNFQQVRQLKFAVSNSSVEQTAIATILSDMDNELTALEQKLAKARDLKQGMMQQLLTGRIRLPLSKEA
ncbi:restriction endonuclease subunit S [Aeromonas veronii]